MPRRKRIGAAGAVAVATVLCGTVMVGTVHKGLAAELPIETFIPKPKLPTPEPGNSPLPKSPLDVLGNPTRDAPALGTDSAPVIDTTGKNDVRLPPTSPSDLSVAPTNDVYLNETLNDLFAQARPGIIAKINAAPHGPLTRNQVESLINDELVNVLSNNKKTNEPGAPVSVEFFTGNVKIRKVKTVCGIEFSCGEVKIYKIIEMVGGSILACEQVAGTPNPLECLSL